MYDARFPRTHGGTRPPRARATAAPRTRMTELLAIPELRAQALRRVLSPLLAARHVVLTTHVGADGDGSGSEAAVAAWLEGRGGRVSIVNPTPFPESFRFLLHRHDVVADLGTDAAREALAGADLFLVLDTSEPKRVGDLAPCLPHDRTVVVDHHPAGRAVVGALAVQDAEAAATGELVFDMVTLAGDELTPQIALGAYVALVSDTGSFRYGNTTPRVHAIAADLMSRGIDPEDVYRRLFATAPRRRLDLLRDALGSLETDEVVPLAWMTVTGETARRYGATAEDFDGLIEHVRSIEGTEVALLFRETDDGQTKISFRSNGEADVNRLAREFGGGGHVKAAGALVPGRAADVAPRVIDAARGALIGA
ncbi:MAG TPA: bifunctional oligoribonuclease/PAP phosphatase NrnA [Longimicrobiaceae bacterium]|jgi:phosphoesterase RecJ-like protein|nr:bifunctional oligoribonuclease/PAP phosphatase NrnA [Longimicrobiaceae bacterium]